MDYEVFIIMPIRTVMDRLHNNFNYLWAFSLLLGVFVPLNSTVAENVFRPNETTAPPPAVVEAQEEEAIEDEFADLLSDDPKPKLEKKKKAKKKKIDKSPIVTWGVDKEKIREPTSTLQAQAPSNAVVRSQVQKGPVNQGKLSDAIAKEAPTPQLDLAPVEWDLESSEIPPNEVPLVSEVAVILSSQAFFPKKVHLASGKESRIYFTTTNKKPAALIIERLNIQRWIAKDGGAIRENDTTRAPWEFTKELSRDRLTEIIVTPRKGTYVFYDALTGARGEIVVE